MSTQVFDRFKIVDVDCHITEPPDIWTARAPASRHDEFPHIERIDGRDVWMADGHHISSPGFTSMAGFDGVLPECPLTYDDIPASMHDPNARLKHMDAEGIYAEVLYPNIGGFGNGFFLRIQRRELVNECVRIYNDWLVDWTSADPNRLIAVTAVPFWDVDFAVKEITRCAEMGHRSINFCNQPDDFGFPSLSSKHWDPIWALAQEAGLSVGFHIGGGNLGIGTEEEQQEMGWKTNFSKISTLIFVDNYRCIAELIFGGVCHRFPELNLVSVESGIGGIPAFLETADWQWGNGEVAVEHPEYDLLPSEYFRRQVYGCFWFETAPARFAIEQYPDNILYETDFPHPTCQHPGPRTVATHPREYAERALSDLPDELLNKVFFENASRLYKIS